MTKEYERRGETIGQEIRGNGYIYMNIGDLDNKKNWIVAGNMNRFITSNIYENEGTYEIEMEDSYSEKALDSTECAAERHTYMTVKLNQEGVEFQSIVSIVRCLTLKNVNGLDVDSNERTFELKVEMRS
ncbi:hypothetical protein [Alkalihalobacillus deserti]|uniref:hypothetical protein n=1 Tax=Alkalihalobacillus deserti TaxID=2879466 RepID=UPI001D15356C|nr:hypothetical protein [Alkalihalobacillus deserti]